MPVTCRVLEKISGMISTPTLSDFAVTNGSLLKAGSSAIVMLSADTLPENIERLRLPNLHLPSQGGAEFGFQLRAKCVYVHQERQNQQDNDEDSNPDYRDPDLHASYGICLSRSESVPGWTRSKSASPAHKENPQSEGGLR